MGTKVKIAIGVQSLGTARFSPKSISGLKAWFNGDLDVYSDLLGTIPSIANGVIRLWKDQSGNANHVNQTTDTYLPRYLTQNVNGHSVVKFDSGDIGNTFLQNTSVSGLSQPVTVFSVHYIDESVSTAVNRIMWCDAVSSPYFFQTGTTGKLTLASGATLQEANSRGNHVWVVCSVVLNGASSVIYANGVSVASGNAGSNSMTGIALGAQGGSSELGGRGAEYLFYSGVLSTANRQAVEKYLGAKYSVAIG